jgi:hypothetical protein
VHAGDLAAALRFGPGIGDDGQPPEHPHLGGDAANEAVGQELRERVRRHHEERRERGHKRSGENNLAPPEAIQQVARRQPGR